VNGWGVVRGGGGGERPEPESVMVVLLIGGRWLVVGCWSMNVALDMSPQIAKNRKKSQKIAKVFRHVAKFFDV
jgi:hypothetical protein